MFQPRRNRYPLYGAYVSDQTLATALLSGLLTLGQVYSGMLAQDEVREAASGSALESTARVYQDGFQVSTPFKSTLRVY